MSDPHSGSDEPMIPDELVPRQQSEDPVPGNPAATDDEDDDEVGRNDPAG